MVSVVIHLGKDNKESYMSNISKNIKLVLLHALIIGSCFYSSLELYGKKQSNLAENKNIEKSDLYISNNEFLLN